MNRYSVHLLIDGDTDRDAIRDVLEPRYAVDGPIESTDLCIVDDELLTRNLAALETMTEEETPRFYPVVWLRHRDGLDSFDLPEPDAREGPPVVDDVVIAPVPPVVLYRRLDTLLVRRDQSISIARHREQRASRFHALFDAIPDPAFLLDEQETIVQVNNEFCRMTGSRRSGLLGSSIEQHLEPDWDTDSGFVPWPGSGGDDPRPVTVTDGSGDVVHATLSTRRVEVGGDVCTVGTLTDVTELYETIDRLQHYAGVLTHDLRNPLQVAQGRIPFVRGDRPDRREHVDTIERSLRRMEDLIETLRAASRTKGEPIERDALCLETVARDAWQCVDTADVTLFVDDTRTIHANRSRLLELFENVFRNALEHAGESATVRVGLLSNGWFVEDDGPGIPDEQREDVLSRGYSTRSDGSGLGLGIVADISDTHGWSVSVTDGTDGGARFE